MPEGTNRMIETELERVKDNQSELYELDRKRQQDIATMRSDITEIKTEQKFIKEDVTELKTDMAGVKTDMAEFKTNQKEMQQDIKSIRSSIENHRWQPKDYVAVIVAVLALVGTVLSTVLAH